MVRIEIEYRHTDAPIDDPVVRRRSSAAMVSYIKDLMCDLEMEDIPCTFKETKIENGTSSIIINGKSVQEIVDGLAIKYLEADDDPDQPGKVTFGRPILDWKREYAEDVPDTIMKNAIAKVYADGVKNDLPVMN